MRTEKTFGIIALIGLFFLLMDFPGGYILLIKSLSGLAFLYFPFGFYFLCDKNIKRQNLILSVLSGWWGLSVVPLGILFKLMHWPGGQNMLFIGVISAPILLIVIFLLKRKAKEELTTYYRNMFIRTSIWVVLAIFFCFTPNTTLWKIQHRNDPELLDVRIKYHEGRSNENHIDFRRRRDSLRFEEWRLQRLEQQQTENEIE
ncbi:MAG: hypothetical protein FWC94_01865 [Bacteroidales bacterium]|nr:hypothetical protein [Bacteroidales bacterium]